MGARRPPFPSSQVVNERETLQCYFFRQRREADPSSPRPRSVSVAGSGITSVSWKLVRASDSNNVLVPLKPFTVPTELKPGISPAPTHVAGRLLKKQSVGAAFRNGSVWSVEVNANVVPSCRPGK